MAYYNYNSRYNEPLQFAVVQVHKVPGLVSPQKRTAFSSTMQSFSMHTMFE
jgi:hypothetical protein